MNAGTRKNLKMKRIPSLNLHSAGKVNARHTTHAKTREVAIARGAERAAQIVGILGVSCILALLAYLTGCAPLMPTAAVRPSSYFVLP